MSEGKHKTWLIENNYDAESYYCGELRLTLTFAKAPDTVGERQAQQAVINEMAAAPAVVNAAQELLTSVDSTLNTDAVGTVRQLVPVAALDALRAAIAKATGAAQ